MDQIEDPQELEREIERANRLASVVGDQTTYQRLKQFVEELKQNLQGRLASRRSKEAIRAQENFGKPVAARPTGTWNFG
jgi:hypothetical protein